MQVQNETLLKDNLSLTEQLLNASSDNSKSKRGSSLKSSCKGSITQNKEMLESDGIKLFDLKALQDGDDLRMSIAGLSAIPATTASNRAAHSNVLEESVLLLQELDSVKRERDQLRIKNEKM